ncbi:phosphoribosylanthranilate isomerase [Parerythrobacter jejuensis]|uniref:N-(5'-phosphoribosyl)anthranilate isomerase n=1 Tax=Parerythrobacter jejuensis TaxID=795812 RepID=A0A845AT16_9SPHN|nr:phosphoribosylanthranilate isomerase [Parerythrobacter jejuensis]MXP32639.1 phosphoribosylanthranilate isomerase [Parerythrobacter jejuensis]
MTKIKICGLSTPETIEAAVNAGATHIGLVNYQKSPRFVSVADAARLRQTVPKHVKTVLLLVNETAENTARAIGAIKPDIVQFHGGETPEWTSLVRKQTGLEVWRALGVRDAATLEKSRRFEGAVDRILFDSPAKALPGGNGETFRWDVLAGFDHRTPWGLAGGLTPDNVAQAIRETRTELVDASSGLESAPGVKDVDRIAAFCKAARSV